MSRIVPALALAVLVAAVSGCADGGDVGLRTRETTTVAHAHARAVRAEDPRSARAAKRRVKARIEAAKRAGFRHGVHYVLHGLDAVPGQDYAVAFKQTRRGYFVIKDSLPMKPGVFYECPPQSRYCTASTDPAQTTSATRQPAPTDPCDRHYPSVCLDPSAPDYDCAGSGEDGPEYVDGPVRILNGDPFDLDGTPRDGIGCDGG